MMKDKTDIADLARALLDHRGAIVGQFTMNIWDQYSSFTDIPKPENATHEELVVSAAIAELFASRRGDRPPAWTAEIQGLDTPRFLMGGYENKYPYLAEVWQRESPEFLKRRNLFASAEFLEFV